MEEKKQEETITKKLASQLIVTETKKNLLDNLVGAIGTFLVLITPNTTLQIVIALPIIVFLIYRFNVAKKYNEYLTKKYS